MVQCPPGNVQCFVRTQKQIVLQVSCGSDTGGVFFHFEKVFHVLNLGMDVLVQIDVCGGAGGAPTIGLGVGQNNLDGSFGVARVLFDFGLNRRTVVLGQQFLQSTGLFVVQKYQIGSIVLDAVVGSADQYLIGSDINLVVGGVLAADEFVDGLLFDFAVGLVTCFLVCVPHHLSNGRSQPTGFLAMDIDDERLFGGVLHDVANKLGIALVRRNEGREFQLAVVGFVWDFVIGQNIVCFGIREGIGRFHALLCEFLHGGSRRLGRHDDQDLWIFGQESIHFLFESKTQTIVWRY